MRAKCIVESCDQLHRAKGFCIRHYKRYKSKTDLYKPFLERRKYTNELCFVFDCNKPRQSRGYCKAHYSRVYRYGDTKADYTKRVPCRKESRKVVTEKYRRSELGRQSAKRYKKKAVERGKSKFDCANRRAKKQRATPSWLSATQLKQIADTYLKCPKGFHVDHIIPLNGKIVCGLHVPWNLQYLTRLENIRKNNKF